jgi:hypothetical protein
VNEELRIRIKSLEWFVAFANYNLKTIDARKRAKLLIEADENLSPQKEMKEFQRDFPPVTNKSTGLAWAVETIDKESLLYWNRITRHQKNVRELFGHLIMTSHCRESPKEYMPGILMRGKTTFIWILTKGDKAPYHNIRIPITRGLCEFVRLKIMDLLEGLPQHAIAMCPGCKFYFFNWTQKKKRFCREQCMTRVFTRERREADPEKYKEYQRKLMYKNYPVKTDRPRKYDLSKV